MDQVEDIEGDTPSEADSMGLDSLADAIPAKQETIEQDEEGAHELEST
jgi:hypothetical protein